MCATPSPVTSLIAVLMAAILSASYDLAVAVVDAALQERGKCWVGERGGERGREREREGERRRDRRERISIELTAAVRGRSTVLNLVLQK